MANGNGRRGAFNTTLLTNQIAAKPQDEAPQTRDESGWVTAANESTNSRHHESGGATAGCTAGTVRRPLHALRERWGDRCEQCDRWDGRCMGGELLQHFLLAPREATLSKYCTHVCDKQKQAHMPP